MRKFGSKLVYKLRQAVLVLLGASGIVALDPVAAHATRSVTLAWTPAADTNVAGYTIYYRARNATHPQKLEVGNTSTATIPGLTGGRQYFFTATSRDASGGESDPCAEIAYTVPLEPIAMSKASLDASFLVKATGPPAPSRWVLEASEDLTAWRPVMRGVDPNVHVAVVIARNRKLAFRLKNSANGKTLKTKRTAIKGLPGSFFLSSKSAAPTPWQWQACDNRKTWKTLAAGSDAPASIAVVGSSAPRMFFRVRME